MHYNILNTMNLATIRYEYMKFSKIVIFLGL